MKTNSSASLRGQAWEFQGSVSALIISEKVTHPWVLSLWVIGEEWFLAVSCLLGHKKADRLLLPLLFSWSKGLQEKFNIVMAHVGNRCYCKHRKERHELNLEGKGRLHKWETWTEWSGVLKPEQGRWGRAEVTQYWRGGRNPTAPLSSSAGLIVKLT